MKKSIIFSIFILLLVMVRPAAAQMPSQLPSISGDELVHAGTEVEIDSTLYGKDIFSVLPDDVVVALNAQIEANDDTSFNGFRIRIYIGSSPRAREESLEALVKFNERFPYIQAYRSYSTPNFKVSVGNFRTRVDAEILLNVIREEFPDAFIARERFKYPTIGTPDLRGPEAEATEEYAL